MTFVFSSSMTSLFAITPLTPSLTNLTGTTLGIDSGNFTWNFDGAGYTVDTVTALLNAVPQAVSIQSGLLELSGLDSATLYELSLAVDLSKEIKGSFTIEKKRFEEEQTTTETREVTIYKKRINIPHIGNVYRYFLEKNSQTQSFNSLSDAVQSLYPGFSFTLPSVDPQESNSGWYIFSLGEITFTKTTMHHVYKYALLGTPNNGTWYSSYELARDANLPSNMLSYQEGDWNNWRRIVCYTAKILFTLQAVTANFTTATEYFTVTYDPDGGSLVSGNLDNSVPKHGRVTEPVVEKTGYMFIGWDYDAEGEYDLDDITFNLSALALYELIVIDEPNPETPPQPEQPQQPQQPVINYTLTVNVVNGTVPGFQGVNTFSSGTNVNLSALAESDLYEFVGWSGDLESVDLNAVVVMTGDKVITATFALIEEPIPEALVIAEPITEPITEPVVEEVVAEAFLDELTPEEAPLELPDTSGLPLMAFAALGSGCISLGSIIRKKIK